jgi:predicted DNA-binding transcriptional regulator YafY
MNRIDRLTAILIQLQTKRVVKAEEISKRFEISLRTVYRDVKALMEAGVPIGSEAGKGYFIVDGFHLPPVMFTQDEASAMLLAGKLVDKMADKSVRSAFESSLNKIKSVLNDSERDHLESLDQHVEVFLRSRFEYRDENEFPNHFLTDIQRAISRHEVLSLNYSNAENEISEREVEPIGIYYYSLSWHLIGWCRKRNEYRNFRSDRIRSLINTGQKFEARSKISLDEYFKSQFESNPNIKKVIVIFDKAQLKGQKLYGSISHEDLGEKIRCTFLVDNFDYMARWLLMFGMSATIEEPIELYQMVMKRTEDLSRHYNLEKVNLPS